MKLASAKLPVTTELITKETQPRVGFEAVEGAKLGPRIITAGEYAESVRKTVEAGAALAGAREVVEEARV